MNGLHRCVLSGVAFLALSGPALAQTISTGNMWDHGTTMSLFGGAASADSQTGALVGLGVGWETSPVIGIEGTTSWLDRQRGADAFAASLVLVGTWANLTRVKPFIEGGVGLYRASFDSARSVVPDFYRRRMTAPGLGASAANTFTDPTLVLGGGANVFLARHVAIRPDVNVALVLRGGHSLTVTSARVHLVYHFEDHPMPPW